MIIEQDLIPVGSKNRPGRKNPMRYLTLHETGNESVGADARAHARYLKTAAVSWHYTVDDTRAVQHLPDGEDAFHAGDGSGEGNRASIGIEVCVNRDGDLAQAYRNTAELCRMLCQKHKIPYENIVFHHKWNGKDCPKNLRRNQPFSFETFLALVREDAPSTWAKQAWEEAAACGITDGSRPKALATREEVVCMLMRARKDK